MAVENDVTTSVCLFHHPDQAQAAFKDLLDAGVPLESISQLTGTDKNSDVSHGSFLTALGVPERDHKHLYDGVHDGGSILAVTAGDSLAAKIEHIFSAHKAEKIDEAESSPTDAIATTTDTAIPVIEEELVVGKRTVDQGGVRLYRRIVEIPVEQSIELREEHISIDRRPVDRPLADNDLAFQSRTIELIETAEEAVVGKSARVVEEVLVGKEVGTHVQQIRETVRHTEVEVEEVPAGALPTPATLRQVD